MPLARKEQFEMALPKQWLTFALISFGLFGLLCFLVLSRPFVATACPDGAVEWATSPTGTWIAEIFNIGCADYQNFILSIRRPTERPKQWQHLFLPVNDPDSVGFKWLDDTHLLIAGHHEDDIPKKPNNFEGVSLVYSTYKASDPDQSRDAASFAVSHRKVSFGYRFEFVPGYGQPGADCNLYLIADGRPEVEQIGLRLTASKIFPAKANAPGKGTVEMPERSGFSILFSAQGDYSRPITFATAASFDSVPMMGDNIGKGNWFRSYRPVRTPAGGLSPVWQIIWSLGKPEIGAILDKIRSGRFDVKIGFWLDNAEIIYSNSAPGDLRALNDFERCVVDNSIFDTKP
jgi:hypothetical protein